MQSRSDRTGTGPLQQAPTRSLPQPTVPRLPPGRRITYKAAGSRRPLSESDRAGDTKIIIPDALTPGEEPALSSLHGPRAGPRRPAGGPPLDAVRGGGRRARRPTACGNPRTAPAARTGSLSSLREQALITRRSLGRPRVSGAGRARARLGVRLQPRVREQSADVAEQLSACVCRRSGAGDHESASVESRGVSAVPAAAVHGQQCRARPP